jgi:hypothetical protein
MSPLDLLESFSNKNGESDQKEFESHYAMCKDINNQNLKFKIILFDDLSKFITVLADSENRSIDCLNQCIDKQDEIFDNNQLISYFYDLMLD